MSAATLDAAIGPSRRILLDTTALIAFHTATDRTHLLARHLFARIEDQQDPLAGFYSVISATEMLVRPIRSGPAEYAYVHTFLTSFPNLHALDADLQVALQAANIRAARNLRTPDAVIVASGLLAGCEAIVGNDRQWIDRLQPLFREFRWIYLASHA